MFEGMIPRQVNADDDSRHSLLTTPSRLPALLVICRNAQTNLRANFKTSLLIKQATRYHIKSHCENTKLLKGTLFERFSRSLPSCFSQEYNIRWLEGIFGWKQNSSMVHATLKSIMRRRIWIDQLTITTNMELFAKHDC